MTPQDMQLLQQLLQQQQVGGGQQAGAQPQIPGMPGQGGPQLTTFQLPGVPRATRLTWRRLMAVRSTLT